MAMPRGRPSPRGRALGHLQRGERQAGSPRARPPLSRSAARPRLSAQMLAYPGRTHSLANSEGPNTRVHMFTRMTRFFCDALLPAAGADAARL